MLAWLAAVVLAILLLSFSVAFYIASYRSVTAWWFMFAMPGRKDEAGQATLEETPPADDSWAAEISRIKGEHLVEESQKKPARRQNVRRRRT